MPTGAVGADSDGTSLPLPMTSSSEAGLPSDGMPAASPPAALTVMLPASDACVSQKARGYVLQVGAHCHVRASTSLLVSKRRRRRRELEHELVTGGRHQLAFLSLSSMLIEFLQRAGVCTPKRVDRCSSWRRLCDGFM